MILIRSQGQLGNQFFLYSAARRASREREWLVAVGFLELAAFLRNTPSRVIWLPIPHRFDHYVKKAFKRLRRLQDRHYTRRPSIDGGRHTAHRSPTCRLPLIFEFGLCQDEKVAPVEEFSILLSEMRGDPELRRRVGRKLDPIDIAGSGFGFCHVRLGDYQEFVARGHSPVLPVSFYADSLKELRKTHPDLPIVVLSDDVPSARAMLRGESGLLFPNLNTRESFWVLMQSECGVLSASTFSWWGARLASLSKSGPFLAPQYWMGFRSGEWFPAESIKASFLSYRTVARS